MDVLKRIPLGLAVAAATVLIDQAAKTAVRAGLHVCTHPPIAACDRVAITDVLGILRTENPFGALGLIGGSQLVIVMAVAAALTLLQLWSTQGSRLAVAAVALELGGVAANLIDRAMLGTVTDFIDVRLGLAEKGLVLNPADLAIATGGIVLAWLSMSALSTTLSRGLQAHPSEG